MKTTVKREVRKREFRDSLRAANAKIAIGPLFPGCEIFGLSGGQWSLIDLLEHCLDYAGPSDVVLSTWTAAGADLGFAQKLLIDGRINRLRFIADLSFPRRQPSYFKQLLNKFSGESIRLIPNHCKFLLVGGFLKIVVRTSMNLNLNKRAENFEISEDIGFYDHMVRFVDNVFETHVPVDARPQAHKDLFAEISDTGMRGWYSEKGKI